ncbi:MAG TPA: aminoglycoside phosphotransferase family protein [Candidatus Polarisedimenticolia bacterium]|nr:aminoglycoside phosphotransferase family protein [Candidatus Polarisedimenticolia bacterium]
MTERPAARRHAAWLDQLPSVVQELQRRWLLTLEPAWSRGEDGAAWVAPAHRDGVRMVLKIGMPHMEADHEIEGLRFWKGDPTVRLLEADAGLHALLLERCEPGAPLRDLPEAEQDVILAGLLRRLWRKPSVPHPFRTLSTMLQSWGDETLAARAQWLDSGLLLAGLRLFEKLARPSPDDVLLATDLHAGNVLRAQREPWLAIDPKPFVGDRAYDATQHLLNCRARLAADPVATIRRFADLLDVDAERVRLWTFARMASEPRDSWTDEDLALTRSLA